MKGKNQEIRSLIAREFDSRMEASIFTYLLDKGMEGLKEITEEEITALEGNGLMTANFVQALVRTAVKICKTYTPMEIMEYIRIGCMFSPFPKELTLYKEDYTETGWEEMCSTLDLEEDKTAVNVLVIQENE